MLLYKQKEKVGEIMKIGQHNNLEVSRETDLGYMLKEENNETEIFLHKNDLNDQEIAVGDKVRAFIGFDKKRRLIATLFEAKITTHKSDWCEVVEVIKQGVFINIGLRNDMFVSGDELPSSKKVWPQKGDKLFCFLESVKDRYLIARLAPKEQLLLINEHATEDMVGNVVYGHVYKFSTQGFNVFTEDGYLGHNHQSMQRRQPRLGERLKLKIVGVNQRNDLNLSMIEQKELMQSSDAQIILDKLAELDGKLPVCDKSSAEDIMSLLFMSKSAFKRAVGLLLKEGKIEQDKEREVILLKK